MLVIKKISQRQKNLKCVSIPALINFLSAFAFLAKFNWGSNNYFTAIQLMYCL